jgi:type IV pilus assembly protein PilC
VADEKEPTSTPPGTPDANRLEYATSRPIWDGSPLISATDQFAARAVTARIAIAIAWRFLLAGAIALIITVLWFGGVPALAIITPIALIVLIPVTAAAMRGVRRRRALVVLTYLEQAVRLNLPLPRMLDAAQRSETGSVARRLTRLASLLDAGAPIAGAVAMAAPETPRRVISLVSAGERLGQLPVTLSRIIEDERADLEADPERQSFGRWYPLLMTLMLITLVMMIMIFVIPRFEDIFMDFGLRLPDATITLLGITRFIANSEVLAVLVLALLAGVALHVLGGAFRAIFDAGDRDAALAAARGPGTWDWVDTILWYVPVIHGIARDRGLADVCRTVADALHSGRPLNRAIDEASLLSTNAVLRRRIANWAMRLAAGIPADQAAREARLPNLFAGMIGPSAGGGAGSVAAFEFLADYYASRFSRSRELLRAAAVPLLVLVFGALVLFIIVALFMPMLELVDHLNEVVMQMG